MKWNTKGAHPERSKAPGETSQGSQMLSRNHHIERVQAVASQGPISFPLSMLSSPLLRSHSKQLPCWGCNKGGISMMDVEVEDSDTYIVSPFKNSVIFCLCCEIFCLKLATSSALKKLQPVLRQEAPFCPLEHAGITWCDHRTSSTSRDKSSFLLRYREQHVQMGE